MEGESRGRDVVRDHGAVGEGENGKVWNTDGEGGWRTADPEVVGVDGFSVEKDS